MNGLIPGPAGLTALPPPRAVAAVGATRVVLVTADPGLARRWEGVGVVVGDDPGSGLNGASRPGMQPTAGPRAAALREDAPGLTPARPAPPLPHAHPPRPRALPLASRRACHRPCNLPSPDPRVRAISRALIPSG